MELASFFVHSFVRRVVWGVCVGAFVNHVLRSSSLLIPLSSKHVNASTAPCTLSHVVGGNKAISADSEHDDSLDGVGDDEECADMRMQTG